MKKKFSKKLNWLLFRARMSHIRWMLEEIKLIRTCILGMFFMACPKNDEQHKQLEDYVHGYDKALHTLETEVVSRAREICNIDNK